MRSILIAIMLFSSASVSAYPVNWTLSNFVFADGGTANGTFVMDSASGQISEVDIYTTAGTAFAGDVYDSSDNADYVPGFVFQFFTDNYPGQTNETALVLFLGDLDLTGGVYELNAGEFTCINEDACGGNFTDIRDTNAVGFGTLTGVPIPAAAWLFGSALAGLGWMRRKQTF